MTSSRKFDQAAKLFKEFTGHDAGEGVIGTIDLTDCSEVVFIVGECTGIMYRTVRDGEEEDYIHEFGAGPKRSGGPKKTSRPVLAVSFDGKQAYILAGGYKFTDRGFIG